MLTEGPPSLGGWVPGPIRFPELAHLMVMAWGQCLIRGVLLPVLSLRLLTVTY